MGMNQKKQNGTCIADFCYKDGEHYRKVGSLIYFRSHDADVKLDLIPIGLWKTGEEWLIGNFIPSEKIPEPEFIDGDIMARTDERGVKIKIGHIHTRDDAGGNAQYYMQMFGIPIGQWRDLISKQGEGRSSLYLPITME